MKKIISLLLISALCISFMQAVPAAAESVQAETSGTCRSYLTGKEVPVSIGRTRPIAIMIENDSGAAKWQNGTSFADVVYEARVEGGITRLLALFEDYESAPMIMPVRSCRPQYVYYSREFKAFYCHYGQVIYAVQLLQMPEAHDIAGLPFGEDGQQYRLNDGSTAYWRHHEGVTGISTNHEKLQTWISNAGWDTSYPEDYDGHYQFAADGEEVELPDGEEAAVILPGFTSNHARLEYDEEEKVYRRYEFGDPQVDHLTNTQLSFKNVIIQICSGRMLDDSYLFADPVNGGQRGEGWYITNGRAERITWQKENWDSSDPIIDTVTSAKTSFDIRESDFNVTRYYDADGNEIKLNQGKTMVEILTESDANRLVITGDRSVDSHIIDGM